MVRLGGAKETVNKVGVEIDIGGAPSARVMEERKWVAAGRCNRRQDCIEASNWWLLNVEQQNVSLACN